MVILLIVLLWIVSIAIRVTSSGIKTVSRVNRRAGKLASRAVDKVKQKEQKDSKTAEIDKSVNKGIKETKKIVGKAEKVAVRGVAVALRLVRIFIDMFRRVLMLILPHILVLDLIVIIILTTVASSVVLLYGDSESSGGSHRTTSSSSTTENSGKSKILLIGDSRTVLIAAYSFGKETSMENGDPIYCGDVNDNDYIYAKSSMGLSWVKSNEAEIEKHIDSDTNVVMHMGTNDCYDSSSADTYIEYMNSKLSDWESKGASVWFASTTPINDSKAAGTYQVKDSHVTAFNDKVKAGLDSKIGWIDTYGAVKDKVLAGEGTDDGVHYDKEICDMIKDKIWEIEGKAGGNTSGTLDGFKAISQLPDLPTGCEVTSLTMALNYKGVSADKNDIANNYLEKGKAGETDPKEKFIGNPTGSGSENFGCYAPVIVKTANKYLQAKNSSLKAKDVSGGELESLFSYIDKGTPVIVWGTIDCQEAKNTVTWTVNGKEVKWYSPEHCMCLCGYSENKISVGDPMKGSVVEYDIKSFKKAYNSLFKQAVVIE